MGGEILRSGCILLLSALFCVAWIPAAYGDDLVLLADLGSTSSIFNLADIDGALFFSGTQPATGSELWTSDGTPSGTALVMDIDPGDWGSSPMHFAGLNGVALFQANDRVHDAELWRSGGTAASTWMVKDINIYYHSSPAYLTNYNGAVYFYAIGLDGAELYRTDGTEAGTVLVKDINPGGNGSAPNHFTEVGGILFFAAGDDNTGYELWKTDGTGAGTVLVKEINPSYGSNPALLTPVGSTLFFSADDGTDGYDLWKSDGTEAGTVMVKDVWPGPSMVAFNGQLFFAATDGAGDLELWKSDGTEAGTTLVYDFAPGSAHSMLSVEPVVSGGRLFFNAALSTGAQLWMLESDPTGVDEAADPPVAEGLALRQNHPNPFNPATTISYSVPVSSDVQLTIHDAGGRLVATVLENRQTKGEHSIVWDGRDEQGIKIAPGVYFARLRLDGQIRTRKLTLTKR